MPNPRISLRCDTAPEPTSATTGPKIPPLRNAEAQDIEESLEAQASEIHADLKPGNRSCLSRLEIFAQVLILSSVLCPHGEIASYARCHFRLPASSPGPSMWKDSGEKTIGPIWVIFPFRE